MNRRVAVLYGGMSGEHEISLISAASVLRHLDQSKFDVVPVSIDKQGTWRAHDITEVLHEGNQSLTIPDSKYLSNNPSLLSDLHCDVVFPVMHGPLYEDGTLQGVLELLDVPYVGAGVLSSALNMDKYISKQLVAAHGLPTANCMSLFDNTSDIQRLVFCEQVAAKLNFPVFVKPVRMGSSVGILKVDEFAELLPAINSAFAYDHRIVVEEKIDGREIELAALEHPIYGEPALVSLPGEIAIGEDHGFYSYEAKYLDPNGAELIVPAPLEPTMVEQAQQLARKVFDILSCESMARVDLFLERKTDRFVFNEINTIPGFTSISMYPRLWAASGMPYSDLLTQLIELAIARHARKHKLVRDFNVHSA